MTLKLLVAPGAEHTAGGDADGDEVGRVGSGDVGSPSEHAVGRAESGAGRGGEQIECERCGWRPGVRDDICDS